MEIEVGEVVEISLLMPPYSATEDGPKEVIDWAAKKNSWYRGKVCRVMGGGNYIWIDFGKKLTEEVLWGYDHLERYYGTYNVIVHVNTVRRLSPLDRIAAET